MKYKKLGHSEVEVTPIAFGAWAIGGWMWGGADKQDAIKAVQTAYEQGITTIDTAPVYGFGQGEELVGEALKDIPREKYQILTKYGLNWESEDGDFYFETEDNDGNPLKVYKWASKERVKKECEDSLRRLQTDYIDLYQIHWPDSTTPVSETMKAVQELMDEGKIRAAGVCNYSTDLVDEALKTVDLATNQVPYSLIKRGNEKDVIPQAKEKGMHILPYSPLQRGLLTGKIEPGHEFPDDDGRKNSKFYTDENIRKANQLLEEIKPIAEKYDATFAQLVINWTTRQPAMGTVLVGARNQQQVKDNAGAMDFELSEDEVKAITAASEKYFPLD
ncbi:aldo/keto reductase [Gracilimonas mengyeensis]|uniref:Predicted oxidoreductase n=1 Tax=Gracilimonas mengyeensis TaxID=1302730 RepID=A0A521CQ73_9BACT|nr:aldo/keto reductase [Gracilimonas mengyeensis]SMO60921.1 Predicted oxidoreductase [Gracilimonas mengyeensis]